MTPLFLDPTLAVFKIRHTKCTAYKGIQQHGPQELLISFHVLFVCAI